MPKIYLIDNPQPNAFATGRNPENAAVAATTGLLERLSHEEVAGVMAHELAHVQNRDTLTMTITATLAGAISMLGNFAFFFGGNRDNNNPLGFVGVLVADDRRAARRHAGADGDQPHARIFRRPARRRDLRQSAVARLGARQDRRARAERIHNPDAERNPATAHLFIINPLSGERMDNLFSTHPGTENRIARCRRWRGRRARRRSASRAPGRRAAAPPPRARPRGRAPAPRQARPLGLRPKPRPAKAGAARRRRAATKPQHARALPSAGRRRRSCRR